ncbi:MAG TPA: DUF1465 family protein [Alphaproteobacteria bacterium]
MTTQFFDRTYNEAMALLLAARDYMTYAQPSQQPSLAPMDRLKVSCEAMRLTARLSHIMAWLLAQRAVHAGEISQETAAQMYALSDDDVCLLETETQDELPPRLRELLAQSRALYVRVTRLDELVRRAAAG